MKCNCIKSNKESKRIACSNTHLQSELIADGRPGMSKEETQVSKQEVPKIGHLFRSENRSQTEGSCVNRSDSITWRQANK